MNENLKQAQAVLDKLYIDESFKSRVLASGKGKLWQEAAKIMSYDFLEDAYHNAYVDIRVLLAEGSKNKTAEEIQDIFLGKDPEKRANYWVMAVCKNRAVRWFDNFLTTELSDEMQAELEDPSLTPEQLLEVEEIWNKLSETHQKILAGDGKDQHEMISNSGEYCKRQRDLKEVEAAITKCGIKVTKRKPRVISYKKFTGKALKRNLPAHGDVTITNHFGNRKIIKVA